MNELQALINHKKLEMTVDDFGHLQKKMDLSQKLIIGNYVFVAKVKSTEWVHSYKAINNSTRDYHFIKIYDFTKIVPQQIPSEFHRIRSRVRKQMLMDPQHIARCYQLLQNENFVMTVSEYCDEGSLEDKIIDKKVNPLVDSIQWLRQIIYGLAQLYTQNIYLENINSKKILIKDRKCKVADFQNLQRRLTMTNERLVKRHIYQLAKLFIRLIFGLKKAGEEEITFIMGQLDTTQMLFGVNLTQQVKEFIKLTLQLDQKEMISWKQLVNLKIFHDNSKSHSNQQFVGLSRMTPQYSSKDLKILQLPEMQRKLLQWDKYQCIQFFKTKLILNKLIREIDDNQCYNIHDRDVLQILYLLSVRCMNNIRTVMQKKEKLTTSAFIKQFINEVEIMEKQVSKRFYKYSGELTNKQNEKLQIGKDWFNVAKSIVKLNIGAKTRRDKFLTGIQNTDQSVNDYSKMQQINFTAQCINQFMQNFKVEAVEKGHVCFYLLKYKQISEIKFGDLGCLMFEQYVQQLVNSQVEKKLQKQ